MKTREINVYTVGRADASSPSGKLAFTLWRRIGDSNRLEEVVLTMTLEQFETMSGFAWRALAERVKHLEETT